MSESSETVPTDALAAALARADNASREVVRGRLADILPALGNADAGEVLKALEKDQPIYVLETLRPEFLAIEARKVVAAGHAAQTKKLPPGHVEMIDGVPAFLAGKFTRAEWQKLHPQAKINIVRQHQRGPDPVKPQQWKRPLQEAGERAAKEAARLRTLLSRDGIRADEREGMLAQLSKHERVARGAGVKV